MLWYRRRKTARKYFASSGKYLMEKEVGISGRIIAFKTFF